MVAEITIPLQSNEHALTVPISAVLNSTLGTFVIRVKDKKAEWVPIKRGISDAKMTEILGQISAQDSLVQQASEEIRDGAALN
jgi:hypothetical protein